MTDLWQERRERALRAVEPLAVRMRPRTLEEFRGQEHILGPGKLLRRMLEADVMTSLILHGPPGTGKTTLAELIASYSRRAFVRENAASVGVRRIREVVEEAARRLSHTGQRTILFLDEIHRFTRSQQDVLLGDVERGTVTLIGATTENPLFACNSALVSRSTLFRLEPLSVGAVREVLRDALRDAERGYGSLGVRVDDGALEVWAVKSDGDARRALMALEVAVESLRASGSPLVIDRALAEESIQQKAAVYSGTGDEHFDTISALIKSVRGSDPDAAMYWMARMLDAGEDPRYIARRLAVLASEDIGNADPRAVMVASACWDLVERIGMPEARITLAQCVAYLSLAPKSNASYVAVERAMEDVRTGRTLPVPVYLRDPHSSPVATASGRSVPVGSAGGEGYRYSHDVPGAVTGQEYLGVDARYYEPGEAGYERSLAQRLAEVRRLRRLRSKGGAGDGGG